MSVDAEYVLNKTVKTVSVNLTLFLVILSLSTTVLKSDFVSTMLIHANEP